MGKRQRVYEIPSHPRIAVRGIATRTVIPLHLPTSLTVLTVPWEDLGKDMTLEKVMFNFFSVPRTNILNNTEYEAAIGLITGEEIWVNLQLDYLDLYYRYLGQDPATDRLTREALDRLASRVEVFQHLLDQSDTERQEYTPSRDSLAEHAAIFRLEGKPETDLAHSTIFPDYPPISYVLGRFDKGRATELLDDRLLSPEAFLLSLKLYSAALAPSYKVRAALAEIYNYDIPFGNSPDGIFEKLGAVLHNTWDTVVALVNLSVPSETEQEFVSLSRFQPPEGKPSGVMQGPAQAINNLEPEIRKASEERLQDSE